MDSNIFSYQSYPVTIYLPSLVVLASARKAG